MSYADDEAKYATLDERIIDVGLQKIVKTTLTSCHRDVQTYADTLDPCYSEFSVCVDAPSTLREGIFRRGLPEELRVKAAVIQASYEFRNGGSPRSELKAVKKHRLEVEVVIAMTSTDSGPTAPAAETTAATTSTASASRAIRKRRRDNNESQVLVRNSAKRVARAERQLVPNA